MRLRIIVFMMVVTVLLSANSNDTFVKSAQNQIGKTLTCNPEYRYIKYPMGNIPLSNGVYTDMVVRAFRGIKIDLQEHIR